METPKYLLVLAQFKWLLVVGVIVAIGVGLVAGYTIKDGEIVSRVERIYPASTTILLSSPSTPLFQAEIPGEQIPADPTVITTAPVTLNLTDAALVYAYLVSGKDIEARVVQSIGELSDTESITAVSRTTQPSGDENFPGRLSLPVLDVVAYSDDPSRAELISRTAASEFQDYVTQEQNAKEIEDENRVVLTTLRENPAGDGVGSNAAIPIVVGAGGTFAAFVALAFLLYAIRSRLTNRAARRSEASTDVEPSDDEIDEPLDTDSVDPVAAARSARDGSSNVGGNDDEDDPLDEDETSRDDELVVAKGAGRARALRK